MKIYQYESVKAVKNFVRPLKHKIFGKNGIYFIMDRVAEKAGGAENVKTVIDAGAAQGEYALHFMKHFPNATVYAFEPAPQQFEKLVRRTKKYGRITVFNVALADKKGSADFYEPTSMDGSSLLPIKNASRTTVATVRLDEILPDVKKVDFLKVDVEGAELQLFQGAERVLSVTDNLFVEITPELHNFDDSYLTIFSFLEKKGLRFQGCYGDYYFSRK